MQQLLLISFLLFITVVLNGQPCKVVKPGMTKSQVMTLAGAPTEIDTVISPSGPDSGQIVLTVWQYGDVSKYGHQRVEFNGEIVNGEVIADGKKFDELLLSYEHGDFTEEQLLERIKKLNRESCK
jgi:hypothetical protein